MYRFDSINVFLEKFILMTSRRDLYNSLAKSLKMRKLFNCLTFLIKLYVVILYLHEINIHTYVYEFVY